ncbi:MULTISPECIES: abortive infection system toxin AbiGii family protein [Clostridia]|uniref:Uncharacterized protein n=2 Tax=Clostridia TaxID=186801 RepID=A0A8I0A6W1_9CLOT|nr:MULTISPECIES: abortive infection system toxin AbiGii family protein [Clostridia]MBC5641218.1 hypothetical protein [Clostridium lentum]MBC5655387.1 hypothetical protein [Blautia lenta]
MFVSFNKAFDKKKSMDKIPEPIIKALSEELPSGFKYVQMDKDTCCLIPEGEEINFSVDFIKDNEFNAKTPDELMEYLYRTQKQLRIKSNTIEINGNKLNVSDLIKLPLKNVEIDHSTIIIEPKAFPKPFELPIEYEDGKYISVKIQRQPLADLKKSLFKSIDMESMEVSYIIDEINHSMSMDLKIRLDKAETVEEILKISKIYDRFKKGKVVIGNNEINGCIKEKDYDNNFAELIDFWEKVNALSGFLGIVIKPKVNILNEDVEIVKALYNSFIENTDFKKNINTKKFTLSFKNEIKTDEINYKDEMAFQFEEYKEYSILETPLELYCVITLSNFKINNITLQDKVDLFKYDMEVEAVTEEGVIKSVRFFTDKREVKSYREKINNSF